MENFQRSSIGSAHQSAQHVQPRCQGCPRTIRAKSCSARYHTLNPSHDSTRQWSIKTRQDSVNSLLFPISSPNYDQYSIGLNATWEIDLWGRVQASSKNDRFLAESEEANYEALLLSLQATLAQQYFAHHANHSQQTLLQQSRNLASENLQLHQARLDIGEGRQSDVSKALQELQETEAALETGQAKYRKLHHSMAVLLGQLPSNFSPPPKDISPTLPQAPTGLPLRTTCPTSRPPLSRTATSLRSH